MTRRGGGGFTELTNCGIAAAGLASWVRLRLWYELGDGQVVAYLRGSARESTSAATGGDERVDDVIVIGGGIVGASAAYRLARSGARVTLLDRADAGQATAAGAGIISPGTSYQPPAAFFPL